MSDLVSVSKTELPESRVSLACEVLPAALDRSIAHAAGHVGESLKVPGFRKGKVPAAVVISRVGREAVLDEAIRHDLSTWYAEVIAEAGIEPVGDPEISIGEPSSLGSWKRAGHCVVLWPRSVIHRRS